MRILHGMENVSSIERIADAMALAVMLVPDTWRLTSAGISHPKAGCSHPRSQPRKPLMSTQLSFSVREDTGDFADNDCATGHRQAIDFVDWVFNSSAVLRERASLIEQHEGLTYERDAARREPFALRSSYFVDELTDDLSIAMVKRIQNRYGVEIWPWERAGFTRAK